MFFLTAGYHRYFAHRTFKTSRAFQFVLALGGTLCVQKGVLWWASHHRRHHRFSDQPRDVRSPRQRGFWWAHVGWTLAPDHERADLGAIRDFARYPELRWLDRHFLIPPLGLALVLFGVGGWWALFFWLEIDPTYCVLRACARLGLVWGLREPPRHALATAPSRTRPPRLAVPTTAGARP